MGHTHVVVPGEGTTSLSERYGLTAAVIWEHPENAALRARRSDMNQLVPGDALHIPDVRPRSEACATGARHRFRRRGIPARYRVQVVIGGRVAAASEWELVVDGALRLSGLTGDDGVIDTPIPASARRGALTVRVPGRRGATVTDVLFGRLGPIDESVGVAQRLANLGYACRSDAAPESDALRAAVAAFQRHQELPETGAVDDVTRARIRALYDTRQRPGMPGASR